MEATTPAILEIAAPGGPVLDARALAVCEAVHRQLRPQLPADYARRIGAIIAAGAGMVCAMRDGDVAGLAVYRLIENSFEGRKLYVDDLVTDETRRSTGVGARLLDWLEARARTEGCAVLGLDSGVQRGDAHRFYFRHGLTVASFSFRKVLSS